MSCITLTSGRKLPCKGGSAGIKSIGLLPWENGLVSGVDGEVTDLTGITSIYKYELKNTGNTYTEDLTSDSDARTVSYTGTLAVVLNKLDTETRNQVKVLAMGELIIFVELANGSVIVIGAGFGADLTAGQALSGGAKADFTGWNLTFTSNEDEPYLTLSSTALTEYYTLLVE